MNWKHALATAAGLAWLAPAHADTFVTLGNTSWNITNAATITLSATVPGGNQPQNVPCVICGANQPQQPAGFGYNDYSNAGNLSSISAFSDQGNGGRNTLADDTFATGYTIGTGSPFLNFLLANGATLGNLGFRIGLDINSTNQAETLNSFYFLDLTQHTVLAAYTGGLPGNVPDINNGTGFPDYTLSGLTLNAINANDTVLFVARMSGLNDGPDSFFIEPAPLVVPSPVAGAGLPGLLVAFSLWGLHRRRRRN